MDASQYETRLREIDHMISSGNLSDNDASRILDELQQIADDTDEQAITVGAEDLRDKLEEQMSSKGMRRFYLNSFKYSEDQPRDENGRFGSGGGSSNGPKGPKLGRNGRLSPENVREFEQTHNIDLATATKPQIAAALANEHTIIQTSDDRGGDGDYEFIDDIAHRYGVTPPWRSGKSDLKAFYDPQDDEDRERLTGQIDSIEEEIRETDDSDRLTELRAQLSDMNDGLTDDTRYRVQDLMRRIDQMTSAKAARLDLKTGSSEGLVSAFDNTAWDETQLSILLEMEYLIEQAAGNKNQLMNLGEMLNLMGDAALSARVRMRLGQLTEEVDAAIDDISSGKAAKPIETKDLGAVFEMLGQMGLIAAGGYMMGQVTTQTIQAARDWIRERMQDLQDADRELANAPVDMGEMHDARPLDAKGAHQIYG